MPKSKHVSLRRDKTPDRSVFSDTLNRITNVNFRVINLTTVEVPKEEPQWFTICSTTKGVTGLMYQDLSPRPIWDNMKMARSAQRISNDNFPDRTFFVVRVCPYRNIRSMFVPTSGEIYSCIVEEVYLDARSYDPNVPSISILTEI